MILLTWLASWLETPALWVFVGLWFLNVWAGSWWALRNGERLQLGKLGEGLDLLHKGLIALLGIHLMQQVPADAWAIAGVTVTAIGLQAYVCLPMLGKLLTNTGHWPPTWWPRRSA